MKKFSEEIRKNFMKAFGVKEVGLGIAGIQPDGDLKKDCGTCNFQRFPHICADGDCEGHSCWIPIKAEPRTEAENLVVYKRAILKFGQPSQVNVAIEEMSELTKELCKLNRGRDNRDHILEEIADVFIMLYQLTLIFDDPGEKKVLQYIDEKTKRLENLLVEI